ncbi:LLM class flavin-dependent oxidoreductase [Streptomyces altiplanensis]
MHRHPGPVTSGTTKATRYGTAPAPLSLLDTAPTGAGYTATDALNTSIDLARLADRRGFARYWVAEHHSMPGVSTSHPALLLARISAHTHHIRLGSGGVMLPNHPPLVVAEQLGMLQALAPGRVDLGLGRAPGTDRATTAALRRGQSGDDFPQQVTELLHFLDDDFPGGHLYGAHGPYSDRVHAVPGPAQDRHNHAPQRARRPDVWLLGSSDYSAQLAAALGLPLAFAAHLAPENAVPAVELYRERFRPSAVLAKPYVMIGVGVLAADDDSEARNQAHAFSHAMLRMFTGRPFLIPTPKEAVALYTAATSAEREAVDAWMSRIVHGTADHVTDGINRVQAATAADEIILAPQAHSLDALTRSAQLIADAYDMPEQAADKTA